MPTLHLPDPAPSENASANVSLHNAIKEKLTSLHRTGAKYGAVHYVSSVSILRNIAFIRLMEKYGGRCTMINEGDFDIKIYSSDTRKFLNGIHEPHIYQEIGKFISDCVRRRVKVICIPLTILITESMGKTGITDFDGHSNMLIYRPSHKIVERFEPHGFIEGQDWQDSIDRQMKMLWEVNLKKWIGDVRYVPQNNICPRIGLQLLEMQIKNQRKEGGGFCTMWSFFIAEMVILNPDVTTKAILDEIFAQSRSDPSYIKSVIRGYVLEIEAELDSVLKRNGRRGFSFNHPDPEAQFYRSNSNSNSNSSNSNSSNSNNSMNNWILSTLYSQNEGYGFSPSKARRYSKKG